MLLAIIFTLLFCCFWFRLERKIFLLIVVKEGTFLWFLSCQKILFLNLGLCFLYFDLKFWDIFRRTLCFNSFLTCSFFLSKNILLLIRITTKQFIYSLFLWLGYGLFDWLFFSLFIFYFRRWTHQRICLFLLDNLFWLCLFCFFGNFFLKSKISLFIWILIKYCTCFVWFLLFFFSGFLLCFCWHYTFLRKDRLLFEQHIFIKCTSWHHNICLIFGSSFWTLAGLIYCRCDSFSLSRTKKCALFLFVIFENRVTCLLWSWLWSLANSRYTTNYVINFRWLSETLCAFHLLRRLRLFSHLWNWLCRPWLNNFCRRLVVFSKFKL